MLSHLEGSRSELNFKIISRWFQTSQNAAKNGAKTSPLDDFLAHLGAKMALRCATWRAFGSILVTFVESWARSLRKVTDCKTLVKHNEKTGFLQCCERSWRLSWLILALGWTMSGNLVAILEQLCDCSIGESVSLDRFGFEKMRIAKNIVKHNENAGF